MGPQTWAHRHGPTDTGPQTRAHRHGLADMQWSSARPACLDLKLNTLFTKKMETVLLHFLLTMEFAKFSPLFPPSDDLFLPAIFGVVRVFICDVYILYSRACDGASFTAT